MRKLKAIFVYESEINNASVVYSTNGILMRYKVHFLRMDDGYAVWVPGLPGCFSRGRTKEEALENIKVAIISYLDALEEDANGLESSTIEI